MSFDRKIDQVCEHYVRGEALFFDTDRRIIRPLRPISAASSVIVRVNGVEEAIPSPGLETPAEAKGSKAGPFNVSVGVNDKLIVAINGRANQTLTAAAGAGISATELAKNLNGQVQDAFFVVTRKQQLKLSTLQKGRAARIFIPSAGNTLTATLGLTTQRAFMGRLTVPGWSLVRDPATLSDRPTRFIIFDERLLGFQDFVEIDYTTIRQECRRCGGLGVEHDWRYSLRGDVIEVRDEALLIQEILKIMYTIQGSNVFNPWYGTNLLNAIGRKLSAAGLVQQFIVGDIQDAFRRWQTIKKQQELDVGQEVSDLEYPFRLINVALTQSDKDPTVVFVNVTVMSRSQKPLQIQRGVRVPQPTDLLGATAQQGLFRQSLTGFAPTG